MLLADHQLLNTTFLTGAAELLGAEGEETAVGQRLLLSSKPLQNSQKKKEAKLRILSCLITAP